MASNTASDQESNEFLTIIWHHAFLDTWSTFQSDYGQLVTKASFEAKTSDAVTSLLKALDEQGHSGWRGGNMHGYANKHGCCAEWESTEEHQSKPRVVGKVQEWADSELGAYQTIEAKGIDIVSTEQHDTKSGVDNKPAGQIRVVALDIQERARKGVRDEEDKECDLQFPGTPGE